METLLQDLRHGLRALLKAPVFAALMILTLAVGIGADTAVFSVVHGVLLRPLPYRAPERLVRVWRTDPSRGVDRGPVSPATLSDWRRSHVFASLGAWSGNYFNLAGGDEPRRVVGARVTPDLFTTLGAAPARGRTFASEEARGAPAPVVVLSHGLWQRAFGGDPAVLGATIRIEGAPHEVVGVMPSGFYFPDPRFELWLPMALDSSEASRSSHTLQVVGRLDRGTDLARAREGMEALALSLRHDHPEASGDRGVHLAGLHEETVGEVRAPLLVLMVAAGFVLLIACVNTANVLLSRALERQQEMSIRVALGARRPRLVRMALAESMVLALLAGAVGWALASWGVGVIVGLAPATVPRLQEVGLDAQVLGFTLAISIGTGVLFGMAPALQAIRRGGSETLRSIASAARVGPPRAIRAARSSLIVVEIALAFVLLTGAGLMIRTFLRLTEVELGFRTENRLAAEVSLPASRYGEVPDQIAAYDRILAAVESLPGIESAGFVSTLPLSGGWATRGVTVARADLHTVGEEVSVDYRTVSAGYFEALGIPLRRGRPLTPVTRTLHTGAVLVNESMARRFWPGADPLGERISFQGEEGPWSTVVGVVGDVRHYGLEGEPRPEVYEPLEAMPWPWPSLTLVVHTRTDPLAMVGPVRRRIWEIDSTVPVDAVRTVEELVSAAAGGARFHMLLLGAFAVVAVVLAASGIFGVMSHLVSQRTRELGTRIALGAVPSDIHRMILRQTLTWVGVGILLGALLAIGLQRFTSALLFGVIPLDAPTFLGTMALLVAVAAAACYLPARRAALADPLASLRAE